MKNRRWKTIFGSYLWQYRWSALMFFIFSIIFSSVFSLYNLEIEAIEYACGLCALAAFFILSIHFFFYWKKHRERREILQKIEFMTEELPQPDTLAEADYQAMVYTLKQMKDISDTKWRQEQIESLDYYMAWVHQIKTPISVMQMLLQSEDTEEYRELSAQLFRIEQYVEMVLGYLRLGSSSSDFVFEEYDADAIIKQAIHKHAPQFIRKRIRLQYTPVSVKILTDEKWFLFLLEQILSNAIKYTIEGSVSITVTKEKVIKIADTGIGIAAEDIPRIFEKGFTGYNGRSDKKSTGLGLYLCCLAAEKLLHKISVESTIGIGTIVTIDCNREKLEVE